MEKTAEKVKTEKREDLMDKFVTKFFDNLWTNSAYLDLVSKNLDMAFEAKKAWNKNMETMLAFFELPNQKLQQKTLHNVNTLLTEWRFEQEELKLRLDKIESDMELLKSSLEKNNAPTTNEDKNGKKNNK
ncbi:MAG: hypothetical protein U0457_10005 [Candidatus Sericytochromatia bacterium]